MGEHDDELEAGPAVHEGARSDPTRVAAAVAGGLARIATALEIGLREVAAAIESAAAKRSRRRDGSRRRSVARPARGRKP
jgi:hypothetical protein